MDVGMVRGGGKVEKAKPSSFLHFENAQYMVCVISIYSVLLLNNKYLGIF